MKMYSFLVLVCSASVYASQSSLSLVHQKKQEEQISLNEQLAQQIPVYLQVKAKIQELLLQGAQVQGTYLQNVEMSDDLLKLLEKKTQNKGSALCKEAQRVRDLSPATPRSSDPFYYDLGRTK